MTSSRRFFLLIIVSNFLIVGCEAKEPAPVKGKPMSNSESMVFDIRVFGYVGRPIFDIFINNKDTGSVGGGGQIIGFSMRLGPQIVTWRLDGPKGTARNGETVNAKNVPILAPPPPGARYLGIHIYPDETVEFIYSEFLPERTERGDILLTQQKQVKQ